MFEWIGDLIDTVGGFFSDTASAAGEAISSSIWGTLMEWIYTAIYDAISTFFTAMGNLGVEIFQLPWVAAALRFFHLFGWALFGVGMVVAIFDVAIEAQTGRANIKTAAIHILKGFMAASLVTVVPLELYKFCITLQNVFAGDLTRVFAGQPHTGLGAACLLVLQSPFFSGGQVLIGLYSIVVMIAFGYCVIKIFFANIKRGGILIIQMAVGTLHLFSLPRGYSDGFNAWCKQIVALCLTAFLQTTLLFMGLMTFPQHILLGLGIMLAATEVPRIAQQFGLDTSAKMNISQVVHASTTAIQVTKAVGKAFAK